MGRRIDGPDGGYPAGISLRVAHAVRETADDARQALEGNGRVTIDAARTTALRLAGVCVRWCR
jgi:hypothetical protein